MRTCEICGKEKENTSGINVYTAKALGQTKQKSGFKQYTITTNYGEFQEHTYYVCTSCKNRASCLVPIIVFFACTVFFTIVYGVGNSTSFWNAILYIIGASCTSVLPAGVVLLLLNIDERLVKKAVAFRKASSSGEKFRGYTSTGYEAVKKSQNPWKQ